MVAVALIILALLLFGGGFAYNVLWVAAVILVALALVSFATGRRAL